MSHTRHDSHRVQLSLYDQLIKVGLKDPFIRTIVGLVVIAAAASFAISLLGNGTKAAISLAMALSFGVVLVILRTIVKNVDNRFIQAICFISAGVIMFVFLVFAVFLIPAALICWPKSYAQTLGLPSCTVNLDLSDKNTNKAGPFKPRPYPGTVALNPENSRFTVIVYYVPERKIEAEKIAGVMLQAGYQSGGQETDLNEVFVPDRRPGTIVIRTTAAARPIVEQVSQFVRLVLPLEVSHMSSLPEDFSFRNADLQVLLF